MSPYGFGTQWPIIERILTEDPKSPTEIQKLSGLGFMATRAALMSASQQGLCGSTKRDTYVSSKRGSRHWQQTLYFRKSALQ
jgi:hypothetical protein